MLYVIYFAKISRLTYATVTSQLTNFWNIFFINYEIIILETEYTELTLRLPVTFLLVIILTLLEVAPRK